MKVNQEVSSQMRRKCPD